LDPRLPRRDPGSVLSAIDLPQHANHHRPECPILLAVDQDFAEGPGLRVRPIGADRVGSVEVGEQRTWSSSARGAGPMSQGGDTGSNPVGTTSEKPQVRAAVVNRSTRLKRPISCKYPVPDRAERVREARTSRVDALAHFEKESEVIVTMRRAGRRRSAEKTSSGTERAPG
jgi:hypothetical protein